MFIVLKKSNILFIIAVVCISVFALSYSLKYESTPVFSVPSGGRVIVLDAGHGDIDGGAVGASGTIEKDINLAVCLKLQAMLEKCGAHVLVTRADDGAIVDKEGKSVRQVKRDDLNLRRNMRDNSNAQIFVSIHMNKFPDEKYGGAQVFYSSKPDNSKVLGELIQKNLVDIVDGTNTRKAKKADNSIYILKESTIPSVIVECGFLSNRNEEKLLKTDEYQQKIAWAVFAGIEEYFDFVK